MDTATRAVITLVQHDLKAAYDNKLPLEQRMYRVTNAVAALLNLFGPLTTVEPIPTAPITDARSDVDEWMQETAQRLLAASIALLTPPSSQSDPVDTKSGPAEHNSECAQPNAWVVKYTSKDQTGWVQALELYCQVHHVSWWFGRTPAQDVDTTSSTSVKQDSKESVENSVGGYAPLPSNEPIEGRMGYR